MKESANLFTMTRRRFVKSTGAVGATVVAASVIGVPHLAMAQKSGKERMLKIGLIGCGGRGTGAVSQALTADPNVKVWAMADVFADQIQRSLEHLSPKFAGRMEVDVSRQFVGLDAYEKLLDSGVDVVFLTSPPGFRPMHLAAAVKAGKDIFSEKPVAVDMAGVKSVLKTAKLAKEKGVSIQHGLCWRFDPAVREAYQKVLQGDLGRVISVYGSYMANVPKPMMDRKLRKAEYSDVEWQIRNWMGYEWLSGGPLIEQGIHTTDKISWAMGDVSPVAAVATGGRIQREGEGDIYDHYNVAYEFPNGMICHVGERQFHNAHTEIMDRVFCERGRLIGPGRPMFYDVDGKAIWRFRGKVANMYQACHNEFFASLRKGELTNSGEYLANATAFALLGREAAHTGKRITWDELMLSEHDLAPDTLKWEDSHKVLGVPVPGRA